MNGIDKIRQQIEHDTQLEIDSILKEAEREASRVTADYEAKARAVYDELALKNRKAADERQYRLESAARMDARKLVLTAKQEEIAKVYDMALEMLCNMPQEQYSDVLCSLLWKASPSGEGQVLFSEKDRLGAGAKAVEKANAKGGRFVLASVAYPIKGGFILRSGNTETNCSFETLVRLQKTETSADVAAILFE